MGSRDHVTITWAYENIKEHSLMRSFPNTIDAAQSGS